MHPAESLATFILTQSFAVLLIRFESLPADKQRECKKLIVGLADPRQTSWSFHADTLALAKLICPAHTPRNENPILRLAHRLTEAQEIIDAARELMDQPVVDPDPHAVLAAELAFSETLRRLDHGDFWGRTFLSSSTVVEKLGGIQHANELAECAWRTKDEMPVTVGMKISYEVSEGVWSEDSEIVGMDGYGVHVKVEGVVRPLICSLAICYPSKAAAMNAEPRRVIEPTEQKL